MLVIALLAFVAAACLTLLAPIAWRAVRLAIDADGPTVTQCALIEIDNERLACFDKIGSQALQPPAKGTYAPTIVR